MKGHLHIAEELYRAGMPDVGAKHLSHPFTEYFEAIEPVLAARGVDGLADRLANLADAGKDKPAWDEVSSLYGETVTALDEAIARIGGEQSADPAYVAQVALAVTRTAAYEYGEAVSDGRIVNDGEYQDGRGMVFVARQMLRDARPAIEAKDPELYKELMADYQAIMAAWPTTETPAKATMTPSAVNGAVSAFEFTASNL